VTRPPFFRDGGIDPLANMFDGDNESDNSQLLKFIMTRLEAIRRVPNGFSVRASLLLDVRTSEVTRVEGRASRDFD